jgi:hypothetical protein
MLIAKVGMGYQQFDVTASKEQASVGQMQMPARFTLHLFDHDSGGPNIDLTWEVRDGVPECADVHITRSEGGHEIRVSGLAGVRIEDCLEIALRRMLWVRVDGSGVPEPPDKTHWFDFGRGREAVAQTRTVRAARKVKITDDVLREVADVYRDNISDKPTEAVAEHFGKQHRTAALYIKRARERGFLGAAIRGKAGEQ